MSQHFRIYEPHECGPDGYPFAWSQGIGYPDDPMGLKDWVRDEAEHRCIRCGHPFVVGRSGEMYAEKWGAADRLARSEDRQTSFFHDTNPLFEGIDDESVEQARHQRVNWSRCDGYCRHAGPMRALCRQPDGSTAWEDFDPKPDACGAAVEALAPSPVEAAWRILTVHHLNGVKADCRWFNLTALCQRCHLLIQRKVRMDGPWPYDHTDWFRPYAAAYYAYRFLGESLDRDETMARLEDLLELGKRESSVERMPL